MDARAPFRGVRGVGVLTHAPLPTLSNLLRAMARPAPADAVLLRPWKRDSDVAGWLSRTAWSLALIAQWRGAADRAPVTLFLPDYFCNDTLVPLREARVKLVFYPLTDSMAPDVDACELLARDGAPDLFLLVHYFGRPAAARGAGDFCVRHRAWLIEDAAHVLLPVEGVGTMGDFVVYSPHKQLPIPDGAVLVVRTGGISGIPRERVDSFGPPSGWPTQLRSLQERLRCADGAGRSNTRVWMAKRALQKLGVGVRRRGATPFAESMKAEPASVAPLGTAEPSSMSRRLLAGMTPDFGSSSRRGKQAEWDALLLGAKAGLAATERPVGAEWTPYLAGYTGDDGTTQAAHRRLQDEGLPVTTWPDLPPEVIADPAAHQTAWQLRHTRIYLPVHESVFVPVDAGDAIWRSDHGR